MSGITILIIAAAAMACTLGGVSLLAHVYTLNNIKSKTVGDGQHGSARWATRSEIKRVYRHIPFTPDKWREQFLNNLEYRHDMTFLRLAKFRNEQYRRR